MERRVDMQPKVSIVIPIYNVEKYLEECLQSIIRQTLKEIEVICVDDASTDDSYKIVREYMENDPRFMLFQLSENRGQAYARNYGMKRANGKYLYFLDSDDYLDDEALKILYEYAEEFDAQGVYFGAKVEYEDNPEIEESVVYSICGQITTGQEFFIEANKRDEYQNATCFQFWNRKYIDENEFYFYEGIVYEDTLYTVNVLMKADRVACIPNILYHYRKRKTSTTANKGKVQLKSYMIVYYELLKIWLQSENINGIAEGIQKNLEINHRRISMTIGQMGYIPDLQFKESACQYLYRKITQIAPDYQYVDVLDKRMQEEFANVDYTFIYGAGIIADEVIRALEENGQRIDGVIVTERASGQENYKGYHVYELEEIRKYQGKIIIILALSRKYHNVIKARIIENGYKWCDILK